MRFDETLQELPGHVIVTLQLEQPADAIARNVVQRFGKDYDDAGCIAVRFGP